jgi:hypothetical protein
MADGYTGLLAPWIGGAADPSGAPPTQAGVRSLLAPWFGGAGSPGGTPPTPAGYRGFLAFWAGGAANAGATPPVIRYEGVRPRTLDIERDDEEVMLAVATLLARMR